MTLRYALRSLTAGAIFVLSIGIASADGMNRGPRVIVDAPWTWTGFYLGGQVGVTVIDDAFSDPLRIGGPTGGDPRASGAVAGGHIGYNYQAGMVVVGVEADLEWSDASASGTANIVATATPFATGHVDQNWQGSVRGRLGLAYGRTLFYATGGWAWGNFDFGYTFPIATPNVTDRFSETLSGWTIGGGVETFVLGNWTGRVEYRFTDFGDATGSIAQCCAGPPSSQRHDLESHTIRMGLSYKF